MSKRQAQFVALQSENRELRKEKEKSLQESHQLSQENERLRKELAATRTPGGQVRTSSLETNLVAAPNGNPGRQSEGLPTSFGYHPISTGLSVGIGLFGLLLGMLAAGIPMYLHGETKEKKVETLELRVEAAEKKLKIRGADVATLREAIITIRDATPLDPNTTKILNEKLERVQIRLDLYLRQYEVETVETPGTAPALPRAAVEPTPEGPLLHKAETMSSSRQVAGKSDGSSQ